ncbi:hypothetical protein DFH06DRAFT_1150228 [Mycena polygramma]|nr:hypothetical protein DFH06DRAFT_1150228 [Mycena polygramma]
MFAYVAVKRSEHQDDMQPLGLVSTGEAGPTENSRWKTQVSAERSVTGSGKDIEEREGRAEGGQHTRDGDGPSGTGLWALVFSYNHFMLQSRLSTQPGVTLTLPNVHPTEVTVSAFWRRISDLSSRTKDKNGRWIGSPEVFEWNVRNSKPCERCLIGSRWKQCIVDEDHPSCRSCRTAKVSCDRKLRFLYETTSPDFFSSWDLFLHVYNTRRGKEVRAFQKEANKRRNRESVECLIHATCIRCSGRFAQRK